VAVAAVSHAVVKVFLGWAAVIVVLMIAAKYCPWLVKAIVLLWKGITGSDYGL
jgi:hypothetical protein